MLLSLLLGGALAQGQPPQVPAFHAPTAPRNASEQSADSERSDADAEGWRPAGSREQRDSEVHLVNWRRSDDVREPLNVNVTVPAPTAPAPAPTPAAAPTPRYA